MDDVFTNRTTHGATDRNASLAAAHTRPHRAAQTEGRRHISAVARSLPRDPSEVKKLAASALSASSSLRGAAVAATPAQEKLH